MMTSIQPRGSETGITEDVERLLSECGNGCGTLLTILEQLQVQNPRNYLPLSVLQKVAQAMRLPLSQVYSVATFYAFFNLSSQGKHTITICRGTACHTRGSRHLLEALQRRTGLLTADAEGGMERVSQTTEDAQLTVRTVACFGQCALAPVVELDRVIHGHMSEHKLMRAAERLIAGGAS